MAGDIRRDTTDVQGSQTGGAQGAPGPYGVAGGDLAGTYPNPDIAPGVVTDAEVAANANIAESKLALNSDAAPTTPSRRQSYWRSPIGWWKGEPFGGVYVATSLTGQNGNTFYTPIWVSQTETWDRLGLECVTTAGSTGAVIRAGAFADDGSGRPEGALLVDAGTVAFTSTGHKSWTISLQVTPGLYHIGFKLEGAPTTGPTVRTISSVLPQASDNTGSGVSSGWYNLGAAGAFTNPGPTASPGSGFRPMGKVRVASRP